MTNSQLTTVDFYGQPLTATHIDGQPYVAMRPIVENIGFRLGCPAPAHP